MRGDVAKQRAASQNPVGPQGRWMGHPELNPPACRLLPCGLLAENPGVQVLDGLALERGSQARKPALRDARWSDPRLAGERGARVHETWLPRGPGPKETRT